jgi:mRNA-degrading endonuclease toxin of MazEF toxin-antitoxin module
MSRKRKKRRSHVNKYAEKVNTDFKQRKQQLSESVMNEDIKELETQSDVTQTIEKDTTVNTDKLKTADKTQSTKEVKTEHPQTDNKRGSYYKNVEQVISEKKERYKEVGISQRVKRGMVFWYDIDPTNHKDSEHMVNVCGSQYHDYILYGNRPWVVVSCEDNNIKNQMVTVVPMSTGAAHTSEYNHSHVDIFFAGKETCVMCEQIRTINAIELRDYVSTLTDNVMSKIEDAIMYQTGIVNKMKFSDDTTKSALNKIEYIIENIIKTKIEETVPTRATQNDIEDAVTRIGSSLESMFNDRVNGVRDVISGGKTASVKLTNKREGNIEKFYKRYPEEEIKARENEKTKDRPVILTDNKKTDKSNSQGTNRKWNEESAKEFLSYFDKMGVEKTQEKYGYSTRKTCLNMKYYIEKKYGSL